MAKKSRGSEWGLVLYKECSKKGYKANIGKCGTCKRGTSSGTLKICAACAKETGICQNCRKPLNSDTK